MHSITSEPIYVSEEEFKRASTLELPKSFVAFGITTYQGKRIIIEGHQCETMIPVSFKDALDYYNTTIAASITGKTKLNAGNKAMLPALGIETYLAWNGKPQPVKLLTCEGAIRDSYQLTTGCSDIALLYNSIKETVLFQCHYHAMECNRPLRPVKFPNAEILDLLYTGESFACKQEREVIERVQYQEHDLQKMNETEDFTEAL